MPQILLLLFAIFVEASSVRSAKRSSKLAKTTVRTDCRASVAVFVGHASQCEPPQQLLTFEYSEGNDGDWSTFSIRIGNDAVAQNTRVTISTTGPQTLAVLSSVCNGSSSTTCASSRGGTFNISKSSTWNDQGGFNLGLFEANLGYDNVLAEFGLDAVGLGLSAALGPSLESQVVGGITADEYWYGQLGLSVQPTNFTNFASPQPSFFQSLYDKNLIPSLSWAYTAGAKYRNKGVFGSLVFGGYDTSRFSPSSLSFTFASDVTRDLVVDPQIHQVM